MVITITPTTIAKGFLATISAIFCKSIFSDYKLFVNQRCRRSAMTATAAASDGDASGYKLFC
jgi:hypothetical protein